MRYSEIIPYGTLSTPPFERSLILKPADGLNIDYKAIVRGGYDLCVDTYSRARKKTTGHDLDLLVTRFSGGEEVLDIGCGSGVPFTVALAKNFSVTGVDTSVEMIHLARKNLPDAEIIHSDIMTIKFDEDSFDAVTAFYSIFHLPRDEQRELFRRIFQWLRPGGYLFCTLSYSGEEGYTESDFFGVTMYWSNHSLKEYMEILDDVGFNLLVSAELSHGYVGRHGLPAERHPIILAQRPHC